MSGVGAVADASGHDGSLVVSDTVVVKDFQIGAFLDGSLPFGAEPGDSHPADHCRVFGFRLGGWFSGLGFGDTG